jgi:hypothetical protein
MTEQRKIWRVVAELSNPSPEPFAVMEFDTSKWVGDALEGTVVSLHMMREEAEKVVFEFNEGPLS